MLYSRRFPAIVILIFLLMFPLILGQNLSLIEDNDSINVSDLPLENVVLVEDGTSIGIFLELTDDINQRFGNRQDLFHET